MEEDMQLNINKKRKLYRMHENEYVELPENARKCDDKLTDFGKKTLRSPDLEDDWPSKCVGAEIPTSTNGFCSKEVKTDQVVLMDSSSASPQSSHRLKISAVAENVPPSPAELEEFFAEAEKYVQKRFAEKYNYDIVKDVPLEGRYQWVRLFP